jgi:tetratricopeptide (TPR) repeat protein
MTAWVAIAAGAVVWNLAGSGRADDRGLAGRESSAVNPPAIRSDRSATDRALSSKVRIEALIGQLGSPRFSDRRAAANELNTIGPEAFDQLQAATGAADPEIAASARYLLRQIHVRWTRGDESEVVRRLLRDFGDQEDRVREKIVQGLGGMSHGEGIAPLCRIARFDRSALISRQAAAAIIHPSDDDAAERSIDPEVFDRELGESTRIASQWLRQYQIQLRDPAASVPGWRELIDAESEQLDGHFEETSSPVVADLLWNLADVYHRLGETAPLADVVGRIVKLSGEESDQIVWELLEWFLKRKAWDPLDQFAARYDRRIRQSKPSLYLLAMARSAQGKVDVADELAEEALGLQSHSDLESISAAQIVSREGHFDWAVRQYEHILAGKDLQTPERVWACVLHSSLLQDYQRYQQAADVLERLVKKLESGGQFTVDYQRFQSALDRIDVDLPAPHTILARYHFLLAGHFEQQRDWPQQREQLLLAITHDEEDADVLIAMYRAEDADDQWREATLKRIYELGKSIQRSIDENPDEPILYNQWAWLIANTEGDYEKAVRHSRRSLALRPDTASFLDTLGRCYYAAGDIENAVKYQRRAVRLIPHMQVMQRQLAQFEQALAEQGGRGKAEGGRQTQTD